MKHEYTNELELKTLIMRIQNARRKYGTVCTSRTIPDNSPENILANRRINKYVSWRINVQRSKGDPKKVSRITSKLSDKAIKIAETTPVDKLNYERFGFIIMQMVTHILTKPQFRGYSYYDDFMSDSIYKILRYLDNFDHSKRSSISGQLVNAFAYLSTIIHHSIVYIIKKKKRDQMFIQDQINSKRAELGMAINDYTDYETGTTIEFVISEGDTVRKIKTCLEDNAEFLKDKKNTLIMEYCEDLDIDQIVEIMEIKKKFKNVRLNYIRNING